MGRERREGEREGEGWRGTENVTQPCNDVHVCAYLQLQQGPSLVLYNE